MKFRYLCLMMLCIAAVFSSCENQEVVKQAEIVFNNGGSDVIQVGPDAQDFKFRFSANYEWQVSVVSDDEWLHISPESGMAGDAILMVKVDENEGDERSAIIIVTCDDVQKSVEVIQAEAAPYLSLSLDDATFTSEGGSVEVTVSTNTVYSVRTSDDWISCERADDSQHTYLVTVGANEETSAREGSVSFVWGEDEAATLLVSQDAAEIQLTYVRFECSALEAYCLEHYDTNDDGGIDVDTEALEVYAITPSDDTEVSSLKGIEHFPNLERVRLLHDSEMNAVDFSQNKKLREIYLPSTRLSSLDLSENVELDSISLVNTSAITSLDFSSNPELSYIYINDCQALTSLDLSENRELDELCCSYCALADIDVSACEDLRVLLCVNNKISVLDISSNAGLETLNVSPMSSGEELKYLILSDEGQLGRMTEQDVSSKTEAIVKGRFYISVTEAEAGHSGGVIEAVVKCTESCQVSEIPSWISLKDVAVNDDFTSTYSFTVAENSASAGRQGEIRFSDENGQFKGVLKVTQSALPETYMEFADTAIEAYCLANYDADGDGRISVGRETDEIDVIWMSDVTGTVSLADIKHFRNLNTLGIEGGRINDIDLSHNEKLQQLELLDNYKGTGIDFSHTPDLQNIFIRHSSLTSLDVTMLKKLEDLRIIYADLTELDLSENPELRILFCHNNHLKVLDVSENPKLSNLYVSPMRDGKMLEYLIVAEGMSFNVSEDIRVIVKGGFDISIQETEVDHTGGVIETEITSTESCQVSEIPSWISLKDVVAKDDLTSIYSFTVAENSDFTERQGEIEFSNASGQIVGVLKVIQSALQETYVEFVDATVEAYCLANYDTDGDGRITCGRETDEVTGIYMSDVSGNISLSDIRHFGNLETLGVTGGSINGIDLSHNEKLIYLYLYDNYHGTGIDFSHTPDMQSIFISRSSLKSVDVSMLKKLKTLTITYADLSELDVTGNPELKVLHCHNNRITVLDVSGNPKLSELSVSPMKNDKELEYLIVAGNMSFNVPENTKVIERGAFRPLADTIELPCEGGWFEVAVQTAEPCSVVEDSDWLRSSGSDDLIASGYKVIYYFVAEENGQETERTTVLTVKDASGNDVASVVVRQAAYVPDEVGGGNEDIIKGEDIIM